MADNVTTQSATPATLPDSTIVATVEATFSGETVQAGVGVLAKSAGAEGSRSLTLINPATEDKQDTGNTSLASVDGKLPALGQALAAASVPVVLTAAQVSTLTPPAAIAGFATAAKQDTGNTSIASVDSKIPALGQALAAASVPIVLTAAQVTTLTPPAAITGFATAAKQPALGTAGVASTDVITVQGIASGTAQPVSIATAPVLVAGAAVIGKVGIDQTTPGTTNAVSAVLTAGSAAIGKLAANSGVDIGDVDVLSIAAGDNNIGNVDIVTVPTDPFGANADAASASGSLSAKLRGIATALGITALDLGSGTGGTRTLRSFLDTAQWIGGSGANGTAVQRVTVATDDTAVGALTETAPTTDTASSGLNGRLQRIAQRLTSLISPGLSASVSVTRPSDTTAYGAGDVVGVTGGGTGCIDFNLAAISASSILIKHTRFQRNATAVISGETSYSLYLFSITQPGAQADNAVFTVAAGDQASYLGKLNLGTVVDEGATLAVDADHDRVVRLTGTHIFGVLVTVGAYTPASAAVHVVTLDAVQL